jgi:hypothetical protein
MKETDRPGMDTLVRTGAVWLILFSACRMEPEPGWSAPSGGAPSSAPSTDPDAPAASGGRADAPSRGGSGGSGGSGTTGGASAQGGSGTSRGGAGGSGDTPPDDASSGGEGAAPPDEPDDPVDLACDAQRVSFDELRDGAVRLGARIGVTAVATSQKFLLSHASSGGCLFGAYVGGAAVDGEPRGLLVVSYGDDAPSDQPCPTGTDGIPDELAPGDRVGVPGRFSTYVPSSCGSVAPSPQLLVDAACPLVVSARGEPLDAAPLPFDVADALALGTDAALLRRFAGGLVRLDGVSALAAEEGFGVVGPYGVVRFAETRLPLTNDVRYGDLGLGGPGSSDKSLRLPDPATFDSVTGLLHLDYCAWSLAPRDPCADLQPGATGCP